MNPAQRMAALFAGHPGYHGTHGEPEQKPGSLKWEIKRTARTLRGPATEDYWRQHLAGTRPLGVVPIRDDSTCVWGSIDVDQYEVDILQIVSKVEANDLPLVPCRSKSGGLHLFMFLAEPAPAATLQHVLRDMAASLGLAECEIFPKQTQVLTERGDQGNWMVMPYFGGTFDGKLREQVGLRKTGAELTLEQFLSAAEKARVPPASLIELSQKRVRKPREAKVREPFSDGPPCLQHLARDGVPESMGRNNALFMMGLYYKRVNPSGWTADVEEANRLYMRPPLTADEVALTLRSLEKKDYEYTCKNQPMVSHCDSVLCRGRQYGVGRGQRYPVITSITKLNIQPNPIWFLEVDGHRIELSNDDLHDYRRFSKLCLARFHVVYLPMKQADWLTMLGAVMEAVVVDAAPPDVNDDEAFRELLEEFLTNRQKGQNKRDLIQGRPWQDEESDKHYFRLRDLQKHLQREGVRDIQRGDLTSKIKRLGGDSHFFNIEDQGVNVWWVSGSRINPLPEDRPPQRRPQPI